MRTKSIGQDASEFGRGERPTIDELDRKGEPAGAIECSDPRAIGQHEGHLYWGVGGFPSSYQPLQRGSFAGNENRYAQSAGHARAGARGAKRLTVRA